MNLLSSLLFSFLATLRDILPITCVIFVIQLLVLRRPIAQWRRVAIGFGCVILGLAMFLVGLEQALFPIGKAMALQLAAADFVDPGRDAGAALTTALPWYRYYWTYLFAFTIGFSATIAEPALLAVAIKAHEVSGGTLKVGPPRAAVALGAGFGVMLGTFRIVVGVSLPWFILTGYAVVIVQTYFGTEADCSTCLRLWRSHDVHSYGSAEREVLLFLVEKHLSRHILETISTTANFNNSPGTGIAIQIDVEDAVGVSHQIEKLTELVEQQL